jgi:hypothetical protein
VFKGRAQVLCRDVHVEPPSASAGEKSERREVGEKGPGRWLECLLFFDSGSVEES